MVAFSVFGVRPHAVPNVRSLSQNERSHEVSRPRVRPSLLQMPAKLEEPSAFGECCLLDKPIASR